MCASKLPLQSHHPVLTIYIFLKAVPVLQPRKREPVSRVLLVGGSTRMPLVRRFVKNMTGIVPNSKEVDPDMAVTIGAAVQAGILQGDVENVMMMDVFQVQCFKFRIPTVNSYSHSS